MIKADMGKLLNNTLLKPQASVILATTLDRPKAEHLMFVGNISGIKIYIKEIDA